MKKKVAIIIPSLRGGGAERVIINLMRGLNKDKYDINLIMVKKEGIYLNLVPADVVMYDLKVDRVRYSAIKLVKILNTIQPDIVFSTLGYLNMMVLMIKPFLTSKPKIIIREASTPSMSLSRLSKRRRGIFSYMYKILYPKADCVVAQCKDMKKDLIIEFGIPKDKIRHIYNPIDIKKIKNDRAEYNPFLNSKINILAVGRLTYAKGFDVLIRSFKIVLSMIPNVHLTILGDGELKKELIDLCTNINILENVSFLGFKNNPYPYYYYSDVYVLSSRWEGFPNTLLEALACGTNVVATNCKSGPREIIGENKYGLLVPPEDHIKLAEGIVLATKIKSNQSINRACDFDIEIITKKYEKLFE